MTIRLVRRRLHGAALAAAMLAGIASLVLGSQLAARATHDIVTLSGTLAADEFLITIDETDPDRLKLCAGPCFTRARAEIGSIVVDGFDGDDTLTLSHAHGVVTNSLDSLPVSFNAGTGADRLEVCTSDVLPACTTSVTTTVAYGASGDERIVTQSGAAGRSVRVTLNDVATILDEAPGDVALHGTEVADQVNYRESAELAGFGEIVLGTSAPYLFGGKTAVTIAAAAGDDDLTVTRSAGLRATTQNCAEDAAPAAAVCVQGGAGQDRVHLAGDSANRDDVSLVSRPAGASTLTGLSTTRPLDLTGLERVGLALASSADSLTVHAGSGADSLRVATHAAGATLSGDLATDNGDQTSALPVIEVRGDGTAPLDLSLDSAEGTDHLQVTSTDGDETVALGPTDGDATNELPDTSCVEELATCLEVRPDGAPGAVLSLRGVESHLIETGAGDDSLTVVASLRSPTTWRGGEGNDHGRVLGTGSALTAAWATDSVHQDGAAPVTATAVEQLEVDAAGAGVTTLGTPADDVIEFRSVDAGAAEVTLAGHPASLHLTDVGGVNLIDAAEGDDNVSVAGTTAGDRFAIGRDADLNVAVGALLPVRVAGAEDAVLLGRHGDDRFDITGAGGPATLTADGGPDAGADTVVVAAATSDTTVSVDDNLGTGQIDSDGNPIGLLGIERIDIEGDGTHGLSVGGSDAPDTMTQQGNSVTIGKTTRVSFARFPVLTLAGGPAADQLSFSPAGSSGVDSINASGGAGADAVMVRGTPLSERLSYTPTSEDSGTVHVESAPPVSFTDTEDTRLDGATSVPSGDMLVLDTPHHDGTLVVEPGPTFDAGTVRFLDTVGLGTTAAPAHFGGLGRGEIEFAGDVNAPRDRVILSGRPGDDVITVTSRATTTGDMAVVTMNLQVPVVVPGAHTVVLDGRDGADTFRVPTDHPLPGVAGPAIDVRAGGSDAGDRLDLTAGTGTLVVDVVADMVSEAGHAAVQHNGVEQIILDATGSPLSVRGGADADTLRWQPTAPAAGSITSGSGPVLHARALGPLTIDPGSGADAVTAVMRTVPDEVTVARGAPTELAALDLQAVLLPSSVESLTLATGDGADRIHVTGTGGPESFSVDAGAPTAGDDMLRLTAPDATVTFGTDPTSGRLDSPGGAVTFAAVETIDAIGDGEGSLLVNGTDGSEVMTIGESASPRIRVDEGAGVTYAGYPTVRLDGHGGDDDVTVGYTGLGDISTLRVAGGAGDGDDVTVADTTGTTRVFTVQPTGAGTGTVQATGQATTLDVEGVEALAVDGRGGDDVVRLVSPSGAQTLQVTPGDTADAGLVRIGSLLPVSFRQVGAAGRLSVVDDDGARVDTVVLHGSSASDSFSVPGATGEVRLSGWIPMEPLNAIDLVLRGGDGDDDTTVSGPLPYRTTTVDGGGPDRGDGLQVGGPVGGVVVDLAQAQVVGYGGLLRFPGVVDLHTDVGGRQLTHVGTARDDAVCYDPMAPRDGRLYILGAPGGGTASSICAPDQRGTNVLHSFVDVSHLTVDPAAGSDEVIVNGSTSRDLITIHAQAPATEVTVHPEPASGSTFRLPAHVLVATTESLVVAADNGSDSVDVSTYDNAAPLITVHGEGPSTMRIADDLVVRDATGAASMRDTNSHTKGSGTVTAEYRKGSGAVVRVDYVDMENVTLNRDPKVG